jgi:hypothetical protein
MLDVQADQQAGRHADGKPRPVEQRESPAAAQNA